MPQVTRCPTHTTVPISWHSEEGRPLYAMMILPDGDCYAVRVGDCGEVTVGTMAEIQQCIRYAGFPDYTALPGDTLPEGWRLAEVWV